MIDYKAPVSAATVVARLTVLSARVEGLPSIHLVEDNSPFVKLQCGQFLFATEINSLAGKHTNTHIPTWRRAPLTHFCHNCWSSLLQGAGPCGTT